MKRIILVLFVFFTVVPGFCGIDNEISTKKLTKIEGTLAASGTASEILNLETYKTQGFSSIQLRVSGSGTLRIYHESSNDGAEWAVEDGSSDIKTAITAGSELIQFDLPFAKYLRIQVVETGGANPVVIENAVIAIQ